MQDRGWISNALSWVKEAGSKRVHTIGAATMENSTEVPQKTKNRVAIGSSNPSPGHIPRKNCHSKRHVHPSVHCSTIYNSQDVETIKMSIDRWMVKKMWHIYTTEYYSAIKKNEIMSFAATWMDLETIILREVSQRKTDTIWYHLYVESKMWHKWTYLRNRNRLTEIENRLVGGEGWGRRGLGVWD